MRKLHCANSATLFTGGKGRYRLIICQQDARLAFFSSSRLVSPWLTPAFTASDCQNHRLTLRSRTGPTGGARVKQPVMLDYKQDPTRPEGGVFVAAPGKSGESRTCRRGWLSLVASHINDSKFIISIAWCLVGFFLRQWHPLALAVRATPSHQSSDV